MRGFWIAVALLALAACGRNDPNLPAAPPEKPPAAPATD